MTDFPLLRTVDELKAQLDARPTDRPQTERLLGELRRLAIQTSEALAAAQQENQNLSVYYTFQMRLFEDLRSDKVCEAVAEMAVNFLGTEDFSIFVREGDTFLPRLGMGSLQDQAAAFKVGQGPNGVLAATGEAAFQRNGRVVQLTLTSPDNRAVGFLEVATLLPHKPRLTFQDRELLSIVKSRAGAALALAQLHPAAPATL